MYHIQNTVSVVHHIRHAQSAATSTLHPTLDEDPPRREVSSLCSTNIMGSSSPYTEQEHLLWCCGIFGTVALRKTSKYSQAPSAGAKEKIPLVSETVWTFRPSLISYTLQLLYARSFGHVSRSLNIYPVLSDSDPIFSMCWEGDLLGLQSALSKQRVSPFVTNCDGWTLLHVSTAFPPLLVHDCN